MRTTTLSLIVIGLMVLLIYLISFPPSNPAREHSVTDCFSRPQEVSRNLIYIRDARTNLCFAYLWQGSAYGGPMLTCVPCDSIPEELMTENSPLR